LHRVAVTEDDTSMIRNKINERRIKEGPMW
jgi:hypothetical protein